MSVLIKDMEMPDTCEDCNFHIYHGDGEYVCVATPMFYPMNLANSKGMRKDWCPLTEAPTPTIEPDWNELLVICDNCGHAIRVKREVGENR